jgi:hypothetical protein
MTIRFHSFPHRRFRGREGHAARLSRTLPSCLQTFAPAVGAFVCHDIAAARAAAEGMATLAPLPANRFTVLASTNDRSAAACRP